LSSLRKTREDIAINLFSAIISVIVFIITVYPLYYCLIYSLNEGADAAKAAIYFFPRKFTLDNYKIVFRENSIYLAFGMTILRTVVGTLIAVVCLTMASYALTKKNLLFRKFYIVFGLVTLYFSGGIIPSYLLYTNIHLINTFWVYILPNIYQFFYMLLFMSFFKELPEALEESARIDGANDLTVVFKIILPMSTPVIATIALFVGVWHWNDFFHPAFFITNEKLMTLPAVLMRIMSLAEAQQSLQKVVTNYSKSSVTIEAIRYATFIVAVAPITIVYPFAQKYFVKGMMIGSVKG
jgi:putative aldouronate transport system permease protein